MEGGLSAGEGEPGVGMAGAQAWCGEELCNFSTRPSCLEQRTEVGEAGRRSYKTSQAMGRTSGLLGDLGSRWGGEGGGPSMESCALVKLCKRPYSRARR